MLNKEMFVVHSSLSSNFMRFRGFRFGGIVIGSSAEICFLGGNEINAYLHDNLAVFDMEREIYDSNRHFVHFPLK